MGTKIAPFGVGDNVRITTRMKLGDRTELVRVMWIEREDDKWYFGYRYVDSRRGSWGHGSLHDVARPFGIVAYVVEGHSPDDLLSYAEEALRAGDVSVAENRMTAFRAWLARGGAVTGLLADWFVTVERSLEVARA